MTLQQLVMLGLQASIILTVFGFALRANARPHVSVAASRPARARSACGLVTSTLLLALAVIAVLASALSAVMSLIGGGTLLALGAFVAIGLGIGHWLGGPRPEDSTVLALSTASRHPAIALALAKVNFPNEPLLGAAVILYLLVVTAVTIPYVRRRRRVATRAAAA